MKKLFLLAMLAFVLVSMNAYSYTSMYLDGLWVDSYYKELTYITLGTNSVYYKLTATGNPGTPYYVDKMYSYAKIWIYDKDGTRLKYDKVYSETYTTYAHTGTVLPKSGSQIKKIKIAVSSERIFYEDILHNAIASGYAKWD